MAELFCRRLVRLSWRLLDMAVEQYGVYNKGYERGWKSFAVDS
jgi:hypothetical protein